MSRSADNGESLDAGLDTRRGLIAWFARNPVAANLLMLLIIVGGLMSWQDIRKKSFPEFEPNTIAIQVPYRGASPEEVEEAIVIRLEEAVADIPGIAELRSVAREGLATVTIEVAQGFDLDQVLSEVKLRVDAIPNLPALAERPIIARQEFQAQVIWISVYGLADEHARKRLAEQVREDLLAMPEISAAQLFGDRAYEIAIEVSELDLRRYGLSFDELAQAIRRASLNLPGGAIRSDGGDILLRTTAQAYSARDFAELVLRTEPDGARLRIGDVARVSDGFAEVATYSRFNGQPAISIAVSSVGDQNELDIAARVRDYVEAKRASLPPGAGIAWWGDSTYNLKGRLDLMTRNMAAGALLVFLILSLFLRFRLAFWVMVGIPICFLGALWLMPINPWPVSINMLSLFGFILVLGIVVDDAIIMGESAYAETQRRGQNIDAIIRGCQRVALPATFGVLTTIAAFAPLLFLEGRTAAFMESIAIVVILCLVFSLIESKLILPAHLASIQPSPAGVPSRNPYTRLRRAIGEGLERFIEQRYKPLLQRSLRRPELTLSLFVAGLILTTGLALGGSLRFVFFPEIPADTMRVVLTMTDGTPARQRDAALARLEQALYTVDAELRASLTGGESVLQNVQVSAEGETGGRIIVELTKGETREINAPAILERWRVAVGDIPGARDLRFTATVNPGGGAPIELRLSGEDYARLDAVASGLMRALADYEGVYNISSSFNSGAQEIQLRLKPAGEQLGLSQSELGRQVRQAFFGEEVQRINRGREDVRVMLRYPLEERRSLADLENMRVRTADGTEVPFREVAEVHIGTGYAAITRFDRQRTVTVSAQADPARVEPGAVLADLRRNVLPELLAEHPGVRERLGGASLEQQRSQMQLLGALITSLFLIYALLAIPLKSYLQPLLIMSVIPFGIVGALLGHVLMGLSFSFLSAVGVIALAGVVVNDSLILVHRVNALRAAGLDLYEAVVEAAATRLRPILLTSLTTFFGLAPMLLERSLQAQFIIPMATSLAFGILFATVITLFLVPALYVLRPSRRVARPLGAQAVAVPQSG